MSEPLLARRGLSLDRLETFCRVAESGSIVKAANQDPVRQSLYSRQIRELEEFFGTALIERDGRGIKLTTAGKRLAQLAREQFAALRDFQQEVARQPVTLSIGSGNSVLEWVVTPQLPQLCQRLGNVEISLLNLRTRQIVRDLQDLRLDVGIIRKDAVTKGLKTVSFTKLTYAFFIPASWARKGVQQQLQSLPLALAAGESFQPQFLTAAANAGFTFRVVVQCSSFSQAAELAVSGKFIAVLPVVANDRLRKLGCVSVQIPFLEKCARELVLAWHPRLSAMRPIIPTAIDTLSALPGR